MNNLAFIVQGNKIIGHGHIFRCLRISNFLKNFYNIKFYSKNIEIKNLVLKANFSFKKIIDSNVIKNYDLVIIDKLNNAYKDIKFLSTNNKNLLILDDVQKYKLKNIKSINYLYYKKNCNNKKIISDLQKYVPIYKEKSYTFSNRVKKILIIQGSSDPHKNIFKIFESLKKIIISHNNIDFYFHLGLNDKKNNLYKKLNLLKKHYKNLYLTNKFKQTSKFFHGFDIAVTACGITALDLIYLQIPSIYITNENKELITAKKLHFLKLGIFVGKMNINNKNKLYKNVYNLIHDLNLRKKIYMEMKKISKADSVKNFYNFIV
ncbi:MAG: hypothetical protein CMI90_05245 [Pelagibacteraceae bacterium]|nr:hypothetical protein [Pelagibacteraceae bacterium]